MLSTIKVGRKWKLEWNRRVYAGPIGRMQVLSLTNLTVACPVCITLLPAFITSCSDVLPSIVQRFLSKLAHTYFRKWPSPNATATGETLSRSTVVGAAAYATKFSTSVHRTNTIHGHVMYWWGTLNRSGCAAEPLTKITKNPSAPVVSHSALDIVLSWPFLILWIFRQPAHLRIASENLARNSDSTDLRSFWSGKNSFENDLYDVITVNKSCLTSPWRRMIFLTVTFLSVNHTFIGYNIRYNEVLDSLTCFKCILRPFWIYANNVQNPRAEFGRICVWYCWTYIWTNTTSLFLLQVVPNKLAFSCLRLIRLIKRSLFFIKTATFVHFLFTTLLEYDIFWTNVFILKMIMTIAELLTLFECM